MFKQSARRALAAFALAWATVVAAAVPPPADAYFESPELSGAQLSPDGRRVAMLVGGKGLRARLAVLDTATMKPAVVASFDDAHVGRFHWVNAQRLVFDISTELTGPGMVNVGSGLFAVNADGSRFRQLVETTRSFAKSGDADKLLPWNTFLLRSVGLPDSEDVFVVKPEEISKERVGFFQLQRVNTVTGRMTEVEAPLHAADWTVDASGALRAALTSHADKVTVQWRAPNGAWIQLAAYDTFSRNWLRPRYVAPDGRLYVEAPLGDKAAVFTFDPETRQRSALPIAASKDFDLHPSFIANDKGLLGLRYTIDAEVTQWLDANMKAAQAAVDALLPATANRIQVPARGDSPFLIVEAFADVQPTVSYLYHQLTGKLTRLGTSHPRIDPAQGGQTDFVRYQARDGLSIPAYLTLPPGGVKKGLPLVVLVHGGPWVRGAAWAFDPEVQFLASRGYAVLQPEFRGSTGFGAKHFEAGMKQWGLAMQHDVADGARWAIAQGFADPKRICIAGASYGGYAALMGLVNDSDLFRCGVSWVGVTDPQLLFSVSWSDITNESKRYGMTRLVGDPVADAALLKAVSPLEQAARIKRPLLLAYGAWDVRVPIIHGEKLRDALKRHNSKVEWLVYENEGHGWARPENRIDFWTRVEKFLARELAAPP